jgi:hypothetical protein
MFRWLVVLFDYIFHEFVSCREVVSFEEVPIIYHLPFHQGRVHGFEGFCNRMVCISEFNNINNMLILTFCMAATLTAVYTGKG